MSQSEAAPRRKSRRAQRMSAHARAGLLWGMGFFIVAHLALLVGTQGRWPQLRDPEFGYKLSRLREKKTAEPDRPLLVFLGSSRTGQGMRLGVVPPLTTPEGRTPILYNFSQVGSGPLSELVCLRRMLEAGIRPDWLAVEVLPPLLGRREDVLGNPKAGANRLTWSDLCMLRRYVRKPAGLSHRWLEAQLAPWHAHRFSIMNHYASNWLPWRLRLDHWKALDTWGWSDMGSDSEGLVENPAALKVARDTYVEELKHFTIAPMQDRALHDLLALCRHERIPAVMYLMPEGRLFQSWYPPATRACIDGYLTRLSQEFRVPVVDTRNWMEDKYFCDNHHLHRLGAAAFTRRFGEEVIAFILQGRPEDIRSLLVPLHDKYPDQSDEPAPLLQAQSRPQQPPAPMLSIGGVPVEAEHFGGSK
jgi:hypothetical protein